MLCRDILGTFKLREIAFWNHREEKVTSDAPLRPFLIGYALRNAVLLDAIQQLYEGVAFFF